LALLARSDHNGNALRARICVQRLARHRSLKKTILAVHLLPVHLEEQVRIRGFQDVFARREPAQDGVPARLRGRSMVRRLMIRIELALMTRSAGIVADMLSSRFVRGFG
jgi:hypothetical protein